MTHSLWLIALPFIFALVVTALGPLLTSKVQKVLAGQIAAESGLYPSKNQPPPYLSSEVVVDDYAVYVADAAQIFPGTLIPVVGAVLALTSDAPVGLGVTVLVLTVSAAIALDSWVLRKSAPDYVSRRIGPYNLVGFVALCVNSVSLLLVFLFG